MSKIVQVSGTLTVQSDTQVSGQGVDTRQLSLGPGGSASGSRYFQAVVSSQVDLATSGAVGAAFEALDAVEDLTQIELLQLRSSQEIALRLYALPADAQAVSGAFPTGFAGGETLVTTIDGVVVTTTFLVGDQTAAQCAARINAAMALAGLATPRATVVNGQIRIQGVATARGASGVGQLSFTTTPGSTTLGLASATNPTITDAQGQDVRVSGLYLSEFPTTGARLLTAIEVSGVATIEVLAAGRSQ